MSHKGSPRTLEWVAYPFSSRSSDSEIELGSPALQVDSLPAKPQGKPKNTGVGSLSVLQRIFPTQESNWGLLHCRWILYQLSYLQFSSIAQSCPTLCDPMDSSLPGFSVRGIFQATVLEWVAISFSRGSSRPRIEPGSPTL